MDIKAAKASIPADKVTLTAVFNAEVASPNNLTHSLAQLGKGIQVEVMAARARETRQQAMEVEVLSSGRFIMHECWWWRVWIQEMGWPWSSLNM